MSEDLRGFAADFVKALVTSTILAVVIVGAGYVYLKFVTPEQTPNGLGG